MPEKLTTLRAYGNPNEAELVRGLLEAHGIAVFLADENVVRMGTHMPVGGVKLQVPESELRDAQQILEETLSESTPAADETVGEHSCPICGGNRSEPHADPGRFLFGLMLLGIPFLIQGRKRKCQICGNVWRG